MLLLKALRNRSVFLIWTGQMLSSIGDELYKMAFIWFAVTLIGENTGYLSAAQSVAVILVSLFGGKWADHWDYFRALIRLDILRGALVLIPVIFALIFHMSLPVLFFTSIAVAGLNGFFDPILQAIVPFYCKDKQTLQAANGLMSTTMRMARVLAPVIIGAFTGLIPMVHFFTLDSLTFFFSAFTIFLLTRHTLVKKPKPRTQDRVGVLESLKLATETVRRNPIIFRALTIKAICGGLWQMGYGLGIALLVKEKIVGNIKAFGIVMGAYGIGNVLAALYLGNRERKYPEALVYVGFMCLGFGFIWIGFSSSLLMLALASAFAAIGGPMNDIPFNDLAQSEFEIHDLPRFFRLRTATETGFGLLSFACAPLLFRFFSVPNVLVGIGIITFVLGAFGRIKSTPPLHATLKNNAESSPPPTIQ